MKIGEVGGKVECWSLLFPRRADAGSCTSKTWTSGISLTFPHFA